MLSSGRCTTVTRPALAHWVHSATCFSRWCNGRSCAQRFITHWGNGRSRSQWEKNLTCLAFMRTFFLFRFSALPSTTGMTYLQTLTRCDPSSSPAHPWRRETMRMAAIAWNQSTIGQSLQAPCSSSLGDEEKVARDIHKCLMDFGQHNIAFVPNECAVTTFVLQNTHRNASLRDKYVVHRLWRHVFQGAHEAEARSEELSPSAFVFHRKRHPSEAVCLLFQSRWE